MTNEDRLGLRLTMAHALSTLWMKGYDALLHHGVNMKSLPEFQDDDVLDRAAKMGVAEGRPLVIGWIERLENAIQAAVRRKGLRLTGAPAHA